MNPYCEHPECHSRYTAQYTSTFTTTNGWPPATTAKVTLLGSLPAPGYRRWCKAHALIFEGCCWG